MPAAEAISGDLTFDRYFDWAQTLPRICCFTVPPATVARIV